MSGGRVRRLGRGDAEAYRALRLEALADTPAAFGEALEDARARLLRDHADRLEYGTTFGAFAGGGLAGILTALRDEGAKTRHRLWLMGVYLAPAHRGTGLADALLAAALDHARALEVLQVELHVSEAAPRARAFYARHGFAEAGRSPRALHVGGRFHDELHMIRFLDA